MVEFINHFTGSKMYVDESRVEEYKAAGHKLAATVKEEAKKSRKAVKKPVKQ